MKRMSEWLANTYPLIRDIVLGLGAIWIFIGKRYREIISAPFRKKQEKLTLDDQELSFIEKLQDFQEQKLTKILEDNNKLYAQIEALQLKSKEDAQIVESLHKYIKDLQSLLSENSIEYPNYKK